MRKTFRERFIRLLAAGIIGFVAMTSFTMIMTLISIKNAYAFDEIFFELNYFIPIFIVSLVISMGLMGNAFEFLTRRNECDVFHSLPVNRMHMYAGTLAAGFCWIAIDVFIPVILMAAFHTAYGFSASVMAQIVFKWFLACLYVSAVTAYSVINCGNNIKGSAMAVFLVLFPRMALMLGRYYYNVSFYCIGDQMPAGIFSDEYNIIINVINHLQNCGLNNGKYLVSGIIFTLPMTIAVLIINAYCFKKRKSEIAGSVDIMKPARYIFSAVVYAIPFVYMSWVPTNYLVEKNAENFIGAGVCLFFTVILFVMVEYFNSKKNLKKAAVITAGTLVLMTTANFVGVSIGRTRNIDVNKTRYVRIVDSEWHGYGNNLMYVIENMDAKIYDKEIIGLIEKEPNLNPEDLCDRNTILEISNGGIPFYRNINCSLETLYKIIDIYYKNHILELPEDGSLDSAPQDVDHDEVYSTLVEEMKTRNLIDYITLMPEDGYADYILIIGTEIDGKERQISMFVDETLPKTFELLQNR